MAENPRILFDNEIMKNAISAFEDEKNNLKKAGEELIQALNQDLVGFEGATKDAIMKKIGETGSEDQGSLAYFVEKQVPQMLENLAVLLEANRSTLEKGDQMLADQISGNGK